jgi:hypothetical protein
MLDKTSPLSANLLCFTAARENDNSEIGCLNEEEIPMPSLTGLLFKWRPLIRQIRGRADGSDLEGTE